MSFAAKARRAPLRAVTGAYIVNSGVSKLSADDDTAKFLHGAASGTYGFLGKVDPKLFTKGLAVGEIALGGALLLPVVSPLVAGVGLTAFGGALVNLYWNTDGMHAPGDPRPTQQGQAMAKDVWLVGSGLALVADALLEPAHDKKVEVAAHVSEKLSRRQRRKARRHAKKTAAVAGGKALAATRDQQAELSKKAAKALAKAQKSDAAKRAREVAKDTRKQLAGKREELAPVVAATARSAKDTATELYGQYAPVVAEKAKTARDTATELYGQYAPVVAEKAKTARETASELVGEYGPTVAERAKVARDAASGAYGQYAPVVAEAAKTARAAAVDAYGEYGPVVAGRAKVARDAAQAWIDEASTQAEKRAKKAKRTAKKKAKQKGIKLAA